ncbi:hypothetical protein TX24_17260 [Pseudomonas lactis]|jgi:hypothetical protein|nr:hypothetical protein TX24_17260 [Pseudomonas lactis]
MALQKMHNPPGESESDCMTRDEMLKQIQERFELHLQLTPYSVKAYPAEPEPETKPRNKESSQLDQSSKYHQE